MYDHLAVAILHSFEKTHTETVNMRATVGPEETESTSPGTAVGM